VTDNAEIPVSDELVEELQRRLEAHRASPEDSEPWESVERKVFGADPASAENAV
jgi:hypothetical protein